MFHRHREPALEIIVWGIYIGFICTAIVGAGAAIVLAYFFAWTLGIVI